MSVIHVEKLNEVFLYVYSEDMGIEAELQEFFTYYVPGYKFMPKFKAKIWDGKIRMWDPIRKTIYTGLYQYIVKFAKNNGYSINNINEIEAPKIDFSVDVDKYITDLNIHANNCTILARDYQINAISQALTYKRCILKSPTASGKSLIIYGISRYLLDQGKKILVVVPNVSLVEQMFGDFEDYSSHNGWNVNTNCQKLYSGFPKLIKSNVLFSTWQSIWQLPKSWFSQFDVIIGDEAHHFKAKSLTSIMDSLVATEYRVGTTGSLDGSKVHTLVLEGMFGPVYDVTSTSKLQEEGSLAKLEITSLILNYPDDVKKLTNGIDYKEEMKFLISNKNRNNFIKNLTIGCKGNTLLLFQFVEKHGAILYDMIKEKTDRQIHFIHGSTPVLEREEIRNLLTTEDNSIIIASYGVYSTGVNIPSIENIIFASPSKSRVRNLQSIGRGLRLNKGKTVCKLYDLTDNLSYKSWKNTTLKHGVERYKLYLEEKFPVKIIEVNL